MKHRVSLVTFTSLILLAAATAHAGCDFNGTKKTKPYQASMVRTYSQCTSSNVQDEAGTDACAPVVTDEATVYSYDPDGGCTVKFTGKIVSDCAELENANGIPLGLQPIPCHVTFLKAKCKGILSGGLPIDAADTGWSLATLTRWTLQDATNGDMTIIDFPITYLFSAPPSMQINGNTAESLIPLVGANNADLPPCTNAEFVELTIKDPSGAPFAVPGVSTRF